VKRADMEKRSQLDAFEEFILDEVNEHKMYPSGRVWDNIRSEVQGKRSWPALTIISLTVLVALTVSTFVVTNKSAQIVKPLTANHLSAQTTATKPTLTAQVKQSTVQMPLGIMQAEPMITVPLSNNTNDINTDNTLSESEPIVDNTTEKIEAATVISTSDSETKINNTSLLPALIQQPINNIFDITASSITKQKKRKYSVQ
jgi:hypothetical protein